MGAPEFARKVAGLSTYDEYLQAIENLPVEVDQWQLEKLAIVGRRYNVLFYTPGIAQNAIGGLAKRMYGSPEAAISELLQSLPKKARIGLIPDGLYVFARVGEPAAVS